MTRLDFRPCAREEKSQRNKVFVSLSSGDFEIKAENIVNRLWNKHVNPLSSSVFSSESSYPRDS